ncbi:hypothetical protein [Gallaecimonas pentaromativorans]|uniref:Uncharacterized protein n=2 Tax=Gallaecimonas pentaromativorans TaxID=584787 RepID=A0A3N1PYL4_9GAMM|nr:hypothetical protein EDC28_10220 [Gallaecimonas pentaromativorans]
MHALSLTLDSITCHGTSETRGGGDDVYIIFQVDAGFPIRYPGIGKHHSMTDNDNKNATWNINKTLHFERDLLITLYDQDPNYINALSEYLVSHDYQPNFTSGAITLTNPNGAKYTLNVTRNSTGQEG